MAAEKGRSFTLSVQDPTTNQYDTVGGMKLTNLKINNKLANITDKDGQGWEEFLKALTSLTFTGEGTFKDTLAEELIQGYAIAGSKNSYKVTFESGTNFVGSFIVQNFEFIGILNDMRQYRMTLQSTYAVTYTPVAA